MVIAVVINAKKVADSDTQNVNFEVKTNDYYDNTGIRKAIALARYANIMKKWIDSERIKENNHIVYNPKIIEDCCYDELYMKKFIEDYTSEYERKSVKLNVTSENKELFNKLEKYMKEEIKQLNNENFEEELKTLAELLK